MDAYFKKLIQIGIVVRDIEGAICHFEHELGVGPWRREHMAPEKFPGMTVNGAPSDLENECAFCTAYGMELELIQPLSAGPYMDWLDRHGPGVQHLAFLPRDDFDETLAEVQRLTGKEPWLRGRCAAVGMDFAYLDLTEQVGLMVELHNEDRSGQPGHEAY